MVMVVVLFAAAEREEKEEEKGFLQIMFLISLLVFVIMGTKEKIKQVTSLSFLSLAGQKMAQMGYGPFDI